MARTSIEKTIADLEQESPEDILEELQERADLEASRMPQPEEPEETTVDPTETSDDGPGDEPAQPARSPRTIEDEVEPEDPDPEEDTDTDPLLADLEQRGIGQYKTREAALDGLKKLKTRISQRDEEAALGRFLLESGVEPDRLQELLASQNTNGEKPSGKTGNYQPPHAWDPTWDELVTQVDGEDGEIEYKGPPEIVRKVKENEAHARRFMRDFMRDPLGTLEKAGLRDRLRDLSGAEIERRAGEQRFKSYMEENGEFIDEHREDLNSLVGDGWTPMSAVEHIKTLQRVKELEEATEGEQAKGRDLAKVKRKTRRAGAPANKRKSTRDLAKLPFREAIELRLAESDEVIPEQF